MTGGRPQDAGNGRSAPFAAAALLAAMLGIGLLQTFPVRETHEASAEAVALSPAVATLMRAI